MRCLVLLQLSLDVDVLIFIVGVSFRLLAHRGSVVGSRLSGSRVSCYFRLLHALSSGGDGLRRGLTGEGSVLGGFVAQSGCSGLSLPLLLLDLLLLHLDPALDLAPLIDAVLLLLVPVLDLLKHVLKVNVRHIVVLSQLMAIKGFACARGASDEDLHWLEPALLAELGLNSLDVGRETRLAVPVEVYLVTFLTLGTGAASHEERARFDFEVKHEGDAPV